MTPELQRYYEETLAIFNTPGWKYLVEDLKATLAAVADVRNCSNLDGAKGRIAELEFVISAPERYELAYTELKQETE